MLVVGRGLRPCATRLFFAALSAKAFSSESLSARSLLFWAEAVGRYDTNMYDNGGKEAGASYQLLFVLTHWTLF